MMLQQKSAYFVFIFTLLAFSTAFAQDDRSEAEAVATTFVRGLDVGDLDNLYSEYAGPGLQRYMSRRDFVDSAEIGRIQTGGPALNRVLVGGQPFSRAPTGEIGTFFYFRYRAAYPNGMSMYQDIYLQKLEGSWKIAGLWIASAPPGM